MKLPLLLVASSLAVASAGGAVELTLDNFESKLAGKNGIVKFLAPWYVGLVGLSNCYILGSAKFGFALIIHSPLLYPFHNNLLFIIMQVRTLQVHGSRMDATGR